jgi:hypothetical protein
MSQEEIPPHPPGDAAYDISPRTIAGALIILILVGCESPHSSASLRSAIQSEINRSLEATRRKDIDTFIDGFAPDFQIVTPQGSRITRDTLRTYALRDWAIIPATRDLWMRIDSIGAVGADTAIVYTSQRWDRLTASHSTPEH